VLAPMRGGTPDEAVIAAVMVDARLCIATLAGMLARRPGSSAMLGPTSPPSPQSGGRRGGSRLAGGPARLPHVRNVMNGERRWPGRCPNRRAFVIPAQADASRELGSFR